MIVDKIENSGLYKNLSERIKRSFDYIKQTDLKKLQPGRYDIEGNNIFALISDYQTKLESEGKYIDVQYVIEGEELMGYAPLGNQQTLAAYKEENDIIFYKGEKVFIKVTEGMFAIFAPEDVHMPGIQSEKKSLVKKLVIKVKVD